MTSTLKCDEPGALMAKVQALLKADERPLLKVFEDTKIPYYWLRTFASGGYKNPSVNRIEKLYEYLAGKHLGI